MHLGSLNPLGLNWFSPGRSGVSRAMAKRSWPFGVTSWDDTVKFARLLFGADVAFENYAERLPHRSDKSFLLFAKGACAEGRPFFEIGDLIAAGRDSTVGTKYAQQLCSSNEVSADAEK